MSRDTQRAATQFFGGRVCLDFANTLDWRTSNAPQELIPSFADFLAWSERRGTMPKSAIKALTSTAKRNRAAAEATLAEAYSLRTQVWIICDALRQNGEADLAPVNALLAEAPPQPRLIGRDAVYMHDLAGTDLREPLWPLLWSLTAVLSSADSGRIGCCQAEGCGWFYVDESPNRSRLWCSSEVCGNRERARRAYAKRRKIRPRDLA